MSLSLISNAEENKKFLIYTFQDLQDKLPLLSIYETWSYWYPNPSTLVFMRPKLDASNIPIEVYLSVEFDLSVHSILYTKAMALTQKLVPWIG